MVTRATLGIVALALAALVGLAAIPAEAYTCGSGGCTWDSGYGEPVTLTNGQPLTDLVNCTISYTTAVDGGTPGPAKTVSVPASKATGGGSISKTNTDAAMVPGHTYAISETVTCTSTAFGTSAPSAAAALTMNSGVAPNPPAAPVLK